MRLAMILAFTVLTASLAVLAQRAMARATPRTPLVASTFACSPGQGPVLVLVAKNFIPKGTLGLVILKKGMYQVATISCSERRAGALNDPALLKGSIATHDIYPGSQLTRSDVSGVLMVSLTTPVRAGSYAQVAVRVTLRARCTIQVIYDKTVSGVDRASHRLGPGLGAQQRVAEADLVGRDASLPKGLRQRQGVARRARDDIRPEVRDQHQLALGHAARDGNDHHPEPFAAVVKTEPAREEAIAVGVVQEHPRLCARHRQRAGVDACEEVDVSSGVADHGQLPRRPGRGVNADELLSRDGEHAERIRVPKVVLAGEGKTPQVVERGDVARLDLGQALPVERH